MKDALSEIIQLATVDSEPWVLMVADILKSFPETGSLNLDLEEQNPNVQDILGELREKGGECICVRLYIHIQKRTKLSLKYNCPHIFFGRYRYSILASALRVFVQTL